MRRSGWIAWLVTGLIGTGVLLSAGCASPGATPTVPRSTATPSGAQAQRGSVVISYATTVSQAAGSTKPTLVADMTIENRGYASVDLSPDDFAVMVGNIRYPPDNSVLPSPETPLKPVSLQDGGAVSGKLAFQLPAGSPTAGRYALTYTGPQPYAIQWTPRSPLVPATGTQTANATVIITYTHAFLSQPSSGKSYLVADLTIENRGYDSFNTSPSEFTAVVDNIPYQYDPAATDSFGSALRGAPLQSGGTAVGRIVFQVPPSASTRSGFKLSYSGARLFNIQWIER